MSWGPHLSQWLVLDVWLWPSTILRMKKQACRLLSVTGNLHHGGSQQTSAAMPCCPHQTTNPSFQVSGKLLKYEDALGVTEGIISNPGIPQNVGIKELWSWPQPVPSPISLLGPCKSFITVLQKKACEARRLVCSPWVSAPTKQKLMNDGWGESRGIGQQLF